MPNFRRTLKVSDKSANPSGVEGQIMNPCAVPWPWISEKIRDAEDAAQPAGARTWLPAYNRKKCASIASRIYSYKRFRRYERDGDT